MVVNIAIAKSLHENLANYLYKVGIYPDIDAKIEQYKFELSELSSFGNQSNTKVVKRIERIAQITPELKCLEFIKASQEANLNREHPILAKRKIREIFNSRVILAN